MALSGTINGSTSNNYIDSKITWSATQSITGNYSDVTAILTYSRNNTGYTTEGDWSGSITINGTNVKGSKHIQVTYNSNTEAMRATVRVYHNSDGSKSFNISATGSAPPSSLSSTSCSGTVTLNQIPRKATLTSAQNFNDEGNPVIAYSNPAGNAIDTLQACITDGDGGTILAAYRNISKTGSSYTFSLTTTERNAFRNACKNANSMAVKFYVKTVIGSNTYYSTLSKTLTIVNATPTLSPTIVDTDSAMIALTGDSSKLVRYFSDAKCTIGAATKKYATVNSISCVNGGTTKAADGTFSNITSNSFKFTVKDSRGNSATKTLTPTMINYVKLTTNVSKLTVSADGVMEFTVKGNYFNGSFGSKSNSLTVQYRYKTDGGTYSSWTALTATKSGNTYTASGAVTGLDYQTTYVFQARALDAIYTSGVSTSEKKVSAKPVFDWGAEDFRFNVPVTINGNLTVNNSWNNLTIGSGFKAYADNANAAPKYRVCGSLVTVTGCLTPTSTVTGGTNESTIASGIPSQYCPHYSQAVVCHGSGINKWLCSIKTDGSITMSRYGTNTYADVPAGAWLPFTLTYQMK